RTAERASERRASAKPRHRDRGVGGATAIDDEKTLRLGFCVRLREAIDPEHLVEHDDARAQDRARVVTRASGTQPLPPSMRNNLRGSKRYNFQAGLPTNRPANASISGQTSGPRERGIPRQRQMTSTERPLGPSKALMV